MIVVPDLRYQRLLREAHYPDVVIGCLQKRGLGVTSPGHGPLFKPADVLGIAEGVETALACYKLFGIPTWAALSADNLKMFEPPGDIAGLHIFADNDASYAGQTAAFTLAQRLIAKDLPAEVHIPDTVDTDWLDVLRGRS